MAWPINTAPRAGNCGFGWPVGIGGLALLIAVVTARGMPSGPALVEVVGFGGVFFGGTVLWSAWKLWKDRAD